MTLDPTMRMIIEHTERGTPPLWELPIDEARRRADTAMLELRERFGVEEVARVEDITVPGPAGTTAARLYDPGAGRGVLVYFHGGGHVFCSLDTHDQMCRTLARAGGCLVVAVDYRLAPEHPFPAAFEDAWAATCWIQDHAAALGGDPSRVAVGGDSAGGNLAAAVALAHRDHGRAVPLRLQLLLYPGVDRRGGYPSLTENGKGYLLTTEMRDWFRRCYVPEGTDPGDWRLSPLAAPSHTGLAPAVVVTAQYDPLRDEGNAYAEHLAGSGVEVRHRCEPGMIHGFLQFAPIHEGSRAVLEDLGGQLRRAMA